MYFALSPGIKWILFGCFALEAIWILNKFNSPDTSVFADFIPEIATAALAVLFVAGGYLQFRSWCRSIPFPVEGWEKLSSESDFLDGKTWRNLRIEIQLTHDSTENIRKGNLALQAMIKKANRRFYAAQRGSAKRHQWIITDGPLIAYGTASRVIIADFILLCVLLTKTKVPVAKCIIAQTGKSFTVDAESDTMS